jgi:hypothetical protein
MMWSYPDPTKATARFDAGLVNVVVSFDQQIQTWKATFEVEGAANEVAYSALKIFEGVFHAVTQFLAVREPQTVIFSTDHEDLAEVYQTYLLKESKKFARLGYRLDGQRRVLRRFKPSRWAAAPKLATNGQE